MKIKRCEIVSNLADKDGNILFDMDNMKLVLETKKCIKDYSYIVHDKDVYTQEDEERNQEHKADTLKPAHVHLLLRFQDNQPQDTKYVAKWFKVAENFVNKIKGKWEDALLYQTHANAPSKYQYSNDEIVCNFDYEKVIAKYNDKKEDPLLEAINGILDGSIREYNKTIEIDQRLLVQYSKKINDAFKVRQEHLQATMQGRNMNVVFITGNAGAGKTTLAKRIAQEKGLAYFMSSGSNDILDGYMQQPCIILDDMRPSVLGLSDLLKLLDNFNATSVKSRYKNKYVNADLVIITTVLNIDTFYENVFAEHNEPVNQLKRRCGTYIRMDRESIYISVWDNRTMRYTNTVAYKNNLLQEYIPKQKQTEETVKENVTALMPFLELEESENTEESNFPPQQEKTQNKDITDAGITDTFFNKLFPNGRRV
ncbi:MAG: hypothetical protein NC393_13330 [Clostridium sp.]|nr:hypothetical protein [Clostridium sp.]MCM1173093.1 hypothetical protein [Clostridium sp.]MCM1208092.1 hypothetical protein [Ruminococcus sp.]